MPDLPQRFPVGKSTILDVRHMFPPVPGGAVGRRRIMEALRGEAIHHDGVIMEPGDRDYDGSTLNEDLQRLRAIYQRGLDMGWGGFPYHFVASPNGRVFYTTDVLLFGAHVALRNDELIGVALMGDFTRLCPRSAQLCAGGLALVAAWRLTHRLLDTRGHREWALPAHPTACPGDTWWTWQRDLLLMAVAQGRLAFPTS